jgi:DNA-binding Lrp family transcriptional regulator
MILETLAKKKEYPQYKMEKLVGKTYRTVLRRVQFLEKSGLIRLTRSEPGPKGEGGKKRKIYSLTIHGLMVILSSEKGPGYFDRIAETWSFMLPLVLAKFPFFKANNCQDEIIKRLRKGAQEEIRELPGLKTFIEELSAMKGHEKVVGTSPDGLSIIRELSSEEKAERKRESARALEAIIQGRFIRNVFFPSENPDFGPSAELLARDEAQRNFLAIMKKDRGLRDFIEREKEIRLERFRIESENVKAW